MRGSAEKKVVNEFFVLVIENLWDIPLTSAIVLLETIIKHLLTRSSMNEDLPGNMVQ